MYCIDASVMLNSQNEGERFHEHSKSLMEHVRSQGIEVVVPEILCPEVASAIARGTGDSTIAIDFVTRLRRVPNFVLVPVDAALSEDASRLAAEHKIRGSDAVYVAVAKRFGLRLITLDKQQEARSRSVVDVKTSKQEMQYLRGQ